jgi:nucleoside-diphosphate-sugar epimerase
VKAFLTGASGFLGHAVARELASRGHETVALIRRPGTGPPGSIPAAGDLSDADKLAQLIEFTAPEVVVHLAAEIASQRDVAKIEEVNVHGTERLLDACVRAGGPRFVFASTVVTGDAQGAELDESSELPVETAYGRSKQEGERLVADSGLHSAVMRPSHVYGPGGWYAEEFVKRLRQPGRFAMIGKGHNWWDVVHVDDVATACVDAAERAPAGALYHVVDDDPIRYGDFVRLTAKALGKGPPRSIPPFVARLAAGADPVRAVMRSARSVNGRIKGDLGWRPRYPSAHQGVPAAVAALGAR